MSYRAFVLTFFACVLFSVVVLALTTDQIYQAVYDSTNQALRVRTP